MNAIEEWNQKLTALQATGLDKFAATRKITIEDPELHKAYVEAYNANMGEHGYGPMAAGGGRGW